MNLDHFMNFVDSWQPKRPSQRFSVTFERWDESALEAGETDDRGYVVQDVSLRDAIAETGEYATQANEWPVPRWIEFTQWNQGTREWFEQGIYENRSLHIPDGVSDSSRRRIARLFGLKVG